GRDQQLFERVERRDVERARPPLGRVGAFDQIFELLDDLLLGAREARAKTIKKRHGMWRSLEITRSRDQTISDSALCFRSIRVAMADLTSERPLSTSDICVVIGSSTW